MASGRKTGGKNFEPGHPRLGGRQAMPGWVREAKKLTAESFLVCLHEMHDLSVETLEEISKDKSLPIKSVIMATWLLGSTTTDSERQNLFNRLFGKVTESVEVRMPVPTIIRRRNGEEVVLGAAFEIEDEQ